MIFSCGLHLSSSQLSPVRGWSKKYPFNDGDLTICAQVLCNYLNNAARTIGTLIGSFSTFALKLQSPFWMIWVYHGPSFWTKHHISKIVCKNVTWGMRFNPRLIGWTRKCHGRTSATSSVRLCMGAISQINGTGGSATPICWPWYCLSCCPTWIWRLDLSHQMPRNWSTLPIRSSLVEADDVEGQNGAGRIGRTY